MLFKIMKATCSAQHLSDLNYTNSFHFLTWILVIKLLKDIGSYVHTYKSRGTTCLIYNTYDDHYGQKYCIWKCRHSEIRTSFLPLSKPTIKFASTLPQVNKKHDTERECHALTECVITGWSPPANIPEVHMPGTACSLRMACVLFPPAPGVSHL